VHLDEFFSKRACELGIAARVTIAKSNILTVPPPQILKCAAQFLHILNREWIGFRQTHKNANAPHPSGLLRLGRERPCGDGAENPDELASLHVSLRGNVS